MKVSKNWLKELVDLHVSIDEVVRLLPFSTIGIKEVTDQFIELDMKGYNRADLLSMRGVAYEVSAITGSKINFIENEQFIWADNKLPETKVRVANPELTSFYCIAKIEGLKPSVSPDSWVNKLSDCGMRSINTVADITNLIMLEFGQPLHAFDADQIKNESLIVRCAEQGEELITLDGKVRKLSTSDLLITDPEKAVGIAGVMGGKNSEVTEKTTTILLEAAIFDPGNLRKTAQRLNLPSEASRRFQHGLTKKRTLQALDAAIKMYQDLGGKLTSISIVGDTSDPVRKIILRKEKVDSLIGFDIPEEDIEKYLTQLNFKLAPHAEGWEVTPPYYRLDVEIEADLIEEIARMYGYDKIKAQPLSNNLPEKIDQTHFNKIHDWKVILAKNGLTEVQTYSFFSTDVIKNCDINKSELIKLSNPISAETEYMKNKLWPNLVEVTAKNIKQGIKQVAIFEIGKVYLPKEGKPPEEGFKLTLAFSDDNENPLQKLWSLFTMAAKNMGYQINQGNIVTGENEQKLFHPVRFAFLETNGKEIGYIGEVHPRIINKFGVEKRVAILEITL